MADSNMSTLDLSKKSDKPNASKESDKPNASKESDKPDVVKNDIATKDAAKYEIYSASDLFKRLPRHADLKPHGGREHVDKHVADQRRARVMDLLPYTSAIPYPSKFNRSPAMFQIEFIGILPNGEQAVIEVEPFQLYIDCTLHYRHFCPNLDQDPVIIIAGGRDFVQDFAAMRMTDEDVKELRRRVNTVIDTNKLQVMRREEIKQFPFMLFRQEPLTYIRLYFLNIEHYLLAHKFLRMDSSLMTSNDDQPRSNLLYRILREHDLSHGGWIRATDCRIDMDTYGARNRWRGRTTIDKLQMLDLDGETKGTGIRELHPQIHKFYNRPASLHCGWDMETYATQRTGGPPVPGNVGFEAYLDTMAFCWGYSAPLDRQPLLVALLLDPNGKSRGLLEAALKDRQALPQLVEDATLFERIQVYICASQDEFIETKLATWNLLRPSIRVGYNDGGYDGPILRDYMKSQPKYKMKNNTIPATMLPGSHFDFSQFEKESIKIEAGMQSELCFVHMPGSISLDMMPIYKKEMDYKSAESHTLNAMLKAERLPTKLDVPYERQFMTWAAARVGAERVRMPTLIDNDETRPAEGEYDASTFQPHHEPTIQETTQYTAEYETHLEFLRLIRYCAVDSLSAWRLMVKRSYELNFREDARGSFMTFKAAAFRGNAVKCGNVVLWYAKNFKPIPIASGCNMYQIRSAGKYEGALVLEPIPGIYIIIPTFGLDFASLYPSAYIATGASPERVVLDVAEIERLKALGYSLIEIDFKMVGTGQRVRGAIVRARPGRSTDYDENPEDRSLFATILHDLKSGRIKIKKQAGALKKRLETLERGSDEYAAIEYQQRTLDAKQVSLKLRMNSFYGATGQVIGWMYLRPLAGFIPQTGRRALSTAAEVLMNELRCTIIYGDTDSTYVQLHSSEYADLVEPAADAPIEEKKKHQAALITRTFERIPHVRDHVNARLAETFGSRALEMAYEEVLLPCIITSLKKNYGGYEHVGVPKVDDPHMFIRGMDIKKRGMPEIIRQYGTGMLEALFSPDNVGRKLSAHDIIEKFVRQFMARDWRPYHFEKSDVYRPNKQNVRVQTFVRRMRERQQQEIAENARRAARGEPPLQITPVPEPGARFRFVQVRPQQDFTESGCMYNPSVGELMEYSWLAARDRREIHLWKYMDPQMIRFAAQLCAHELRTDIEHANELRSRMVITQYEESRDEHAYEGDTMGAFDEPTGGNDDDYGGGNYGNGNYGGSNYGGSGNYGGNDDGDDNDDAHSVGSASSRRSVSSRTSALAKPQADELLKEMKKKLTPLFEELAGINSEERRMRGRELRKEFNKQKKEQQVEHLNELRNTYGAAWRMAAAMEDEESLNVDGSGTGSSARPNAGPNAGPSTSSSARPNQSVARMQLSLSQARSLADERVKDGLKWANRLFALESKELSRIAPNVASVYTMHTRRPNGGRGKSICERYQETFKRQKTALETTLRGYDATPLPTDSYIKTVWPHVVRLAALLHIEDRYRCFIELARDATAVEKKKIPPSHAKELRRGAYEDLLRDDFHMGLSHSAGSSGSNDFDSFNEF